MVFDARAHAVEGVQAKINYKMRTTPDGGVQVDADKMFARACRVIDRTLAAADARALQIAAVASDSMVSNIFGVDAKGRAITPVYTYADTRSAREVDELRTRLDEETIHQRVGTLFHTSYLPARFIWLARTNAELFERVHWWMSLGEYFYFRWLGQRMCSYSVASWTGLLNRRELDWDRELIASLPITADQLSPLVDVDTPLRGLTNKYAERWPALCNAVWFPTVGDGAVANVGSGCVDATRVALTIGTSSAMRVTLAGEQGSKGAEEQRIALAPLPPRPPALIPQGLWSYRIDRDHELVGGALSEGGNLHDWMKRTLRLGSRAKLESQLAALPPDGHGLTMLPFLAGERAPGWVADARAAILGLSLNTKSVDILRAGMEGVAYRLGLIFELLRTVAPNAQEVVASGGAMMESAFWVQMLADVLGCQ